MMLLIVKTAKNHIFSIAISLCAWYSDVAITAMEPENKWVNNRRHSRLCAKLNLNHIFVVDVKNNSSFIFAKILMSWLKNERTSLQPNNGFLKSDNWRYFFRTKEWELWRGFNISPQFMYEILCELCVVVAAV